MRQPGPRQHSWCSLYWWLEHSVSLSKVRQIIGAMGTNIRRGLRENSRQHRWWENVVQEVTLRMFILNIITCVFQDDVNFSREHVKKHQIRLNTTRLNMLQVFGGQMCINSLLEPCEDFHNETSTMDLRVFLWNARFKHWCSAKNLLHLHSGI